VTFPLEGCGRVRIHGERAIDVTIGDVVHLDARNWPWHGRTPISAQSKGSSRRQVPHEHSLCSATLGTVPIAAGSGSTSRPGLIAQAAARPLVTSRKPLYNRAICSLGSYIMMYERYVLKG